MPGFRVQGLRRVWGFKDFFILGFRVLDWSFEFLVEGQWRNETNAQGGLEESADKRPERRSRQDARRPKADDFA